MRAVLVSHTHWDREWYRTFQAFRARLVDAVDRVLELCAADPGYRFLLDGQTAVLEDYAEIRPDRVDELRARCAEGRIAIGPWYVQPDSLLPSGEAHVRNLLEGRRSARAFGEASRVAYTPDSFGHPAQFPQLLAGFGLSAFIYWRGNGREIDELPAEYDWVAPDGSTILACHLGRGYFSAASDPRDPLGAILEPTATRAKELAARTRSGAILLMNGIDHAPPTGPTGEVAARLAEATGFEVERGLLEDFVAAVAGADSERPSHRGELVGARVAPLLPGVWSTRTWIKVANRTAQTALEGWAEPFAALGHALGAPDERPALRLAWRELLRNQAHDSICGCSRDEVHEQMRPRFDAAIELAEETTTRCLESIAGADTARGFPWEAAPELAVFNPSPYPRTDVVRFRFDPHPYLVPAANPGDAIHPAVLPGFSEGGFEADGAPVRVVARPEPGRLTLLPGQPTVDLEWVARDVPAFGWKRVRLERRAPEDAAREEVQEVEPGSSDARVETRDLAVGIEADGCFWLRVGARTWSGLGGLEDLGDRGDSYDFDPVDGPPLTLETISVRRRTHPGGLAALVVDRSFRIPAALTGDREQRASETAALRVRMELAVAEGVPRVDLDVEVWNTAHDHRLRLLFPVGAPVDQFEAASTFDVAERTPGPVADEGWVQAAPATFAHQGFVHAAGLSVIAPGLPEAEVIAGDSAVVAVTLLRCVGDLSRHDLRTRPGPAGPGTGTPGAQCDGHLRARLSLFAGLDPARARDAELGLRAVPAGASPRWAAGKPLLALDGAGVVLSALKPAEDGDGLVVRVSNPTDVACDARLEFGLPVAAATYVRLDEDRASPDLAPSANGLDLPLPARALRSMRIRSR